jgi:hypothetical protein
MWWDNFSPPEKKSGGYTVSDRTIPAIPPIPSINEISKNYEWHSKIELDIEDILRDGKAMEEVTIRDGNREIRMGYEDINAILLLIDTLMEMDDDNELARVFKTKLAMQKISGEDCGSKSKR